MLLCLCACGQKNSKDFKVCPTVHSANVDIKSLCLCAIAPLCLAPRKSKIAKQVPARCGQLVELRLKSDRHLSAFILLCLFASRVSVLCWLFILLFALFILLFALFILLCALFILLFALFTTFVGTSVCADLGQLTTEGTVDG